MNQHGRLTFALNLFAEHNIKAVLVHPPIGHINLYHKGKVVISYYAFSGSFYSRKVPQEHPRGLVTCIEFYKKHFGGDTMQKITCKYFCDICGKEVSSEEHLRNITIPYYYDVTQNEYQSTLTPANNSCDFIVATRKFDACQDCLFKVVHVYQNTDGKVEARKIPKGKRFL